MWLFYALFIAPSKYSWLMISFELQQVSNNAIHRSSLMRAIQKAQKLSEEDK
jgi:hypothetical protein